MVNDLLLERGAYAMTLAALYRASVITRLEHWPEEWRASLRDTWRIILGSERFSLDSHVLETASVEAVPQADAALVRELADLARTMVRKEFVSMMAELFQVPAQSVQLKSATVQRRGKSHTTEALHLNRPGRSMTAEEAAHALSLWADLQPELDYYRIDDVAGGNVAVLDRQTGERWWASKRAEAIETIGAVPRPVQKWEVRLESLRKITPEAERSIA